MEVAIQNRKNIRLDRCIQEGLCMLNIEGPVVFMADMQGMKMKPRFMIWTANVLE